VVVRLYAARADEAYAHMGDDVSLGSATSLMSSSYSSIRSLTSLDKVPVGGRDRYCLARTCFGMPSRSRSSYGGAAS
jgi:hypothetical protein